MSCGSATAQKNLAYNGSLEQTTPSEFDVRFDEFKFEDSWSCMHKNTSSWSVYRRSLNRPAIAHCNPLSHSIEKHTRIDVDNILYMGMYNISKLLTENAGYGLSEHYATSARAKIEELKIGVNYSFSFWEIIAFNINKPGDSSRVIDISNNCGFGLSTKPI